MRRRADFERVYLSGRHNSARLMAVRSLANETGVTRLGVSVSKRVGNAVVRNRVRRRLKEAFRTLKVLPGFDVVVTCRPPAAQSDFKTLQAELTLMLRRARLLEATAPWPEPH